MKSCGLLANEEKTCSTKNKDLTPNQCLVLAALQHACKPMSAYELLDKLYSLGIRAPLTIYRALDGLRERGLVHRLESIKAFVACSKNAAHGTSNPNPIFAICVSCDAVFEWIELELIELLTVMSIRHGFNVDHSIVELRGYCAVCCQTQSTQGSQT